MLGSNGRIPDVLKPSFAFSKVHDFKYGSLRRGPEKKFLINLSFALTSIFPRILLWNASFGTKHVYTVFEWIFSHH